MSLSPDASAALAFLVPSTDVADAFRSRSRSPGRLAFRQDLVDPAEAERLFGEAPPSLPSLRERGLVEHLSTHRGPPGSSPADPDLAIRLQLAHLPSRSTWAHEARWSLVLGGGALLLMEEADGHLPDPPVRLPSPGPPTGADYAEVELAGRTVGVQLDASGVVLVSWRSRFAGRDVGTVFLRRGAPRAVVELLLGDGVLR